jgi:Mn-dependent DtxR family transcriptional regulator
MSIELKDIAAKLREDANEVEQMAAQLKHEAKLLREAAYTLSPIGRKPGSRVKRRKKEAEPQEAPATPSEKENGDSSAVTSLVLGSLRENGSATARQLSRDLHLEPETISAALRDLCAAESIGKDEDGDDVPVYYATT